MSALSFGGLTTAASLCYVSPGIKDANSIAAARHYVKPHKASLGGIFLPKTIAELCCPRCGRVFAAAQGLASHLKSSRCPSPSPSTPLTTPGTLSPVSSPVKNINNEQKTGVTKGEGARGRGKRRGQDQARECPVWAWVQCPGCGQNTRVHYTTARELATLKCNGCNRIMPFGAWRMWAFGNVSVSPQAVAARSIIPLREAQYETTPGEHRSYPGPRDQGDSGLR